MKKLVILLASLLLIGLIPNAFADFGLGASVTAQATCATDTVLFIVQVSNTGSLTDSFTVSMSGDAAKWAVAAPAGFNLAPGEVENVYVYVTPASGALVGTYDLKLIVNGQHSGKQTIDLQVEVANCHSVVLEATAPSQEACVCTQTTFPLLLVNTGKYAENFELELGGNAAKWATLSDTLVRLDAGESKQIFAYVTTDCDAVGEYELSVSAKSQNSNALATQNLNLKSNPCYAFDISPEKNYLSFCENTEVKVPITVKNEGTADNTYTFKVDGPRWATMENEEITVPAGSEATANLVLFPEYKVAGDFKIKVTAIGKLGEVAAEKELTANVLTCHSTDLKIASKDDTICPYTSKVYEVSLANTGEYTEHYAISVSGADWASVDQTFIDLAPGTSQKFNLVISPKDVEAGNYKIKVTAESQDSCGTSDSDEITVKIAPTDNCFGVETSSTLDSVEVTHGEGALVPIVIENKGIENATYYLDVSGTGASYAQLNPATITLAGKEAKTVYLYVAVPEETPQSKYTITVSARLADGTVSSSSTINVFVTSAKTITAETQTPPTTNLPEIQMPNISLNREEIKANVGEKISGLTAGTPKFTESRNKVKEKLATLKDEVMDFLYMKTYWFYNWMWIAIIVVVFVAIGAAIKMLPEEEENENKKKKNNGKKKEGGFWKKIENFLDEE